MLAFEDNTAQLMLNGCSLESTTIGMQLTKGTLIVDGKNSLINTGATSLTEGFIFGDGTAADDLNIKVLPGASINLVSGYLDYQNVN